MMELNVIGAKPLSVSDAVFGKEFREDLVHQIVTAYRNAGRAGTKAQLSRSEVSGTTKKFKKQKGGGARHGDYRAPIFVGGGVTFAAKPRDFSQKVNKKMFRGAVASILSELLRQDRLCIVADIDVDAPKTQNLIAKLDELKAQGKTVIVSENVSENLYLAARNNRKVLEVVDVNALNPVALVRADHVIMTVDAVKKVEEWLA
jgi:large subunit ribosomal protein L4